MAQCIVIDPVCGLVTAGGVRSPNLLLLQPARAQCLRLSERFFSVICVLRLMVVLVGLSVPVQVIDWKDSSPK